jgi:hypothetical protein
MLRFKHFSGSGRDLERSVNDWLDEFEPEVSQMVQTVDGSGVVTVGFLFEESFRGQERRMSEEARPRARIEPALRGGELREAPLEVSSRTD